MNWLYNEVAIEDISQFPENTYGFVYKVTHTPTGKSYIGKKVLYFNKKTKRRIKAIMPVHIFGNICQIDKILKIAKKYKLVVI